EQHVAVMAQSSFDLCLHPGKHQDMYSKGHPYPSYPGYIMMTNMNNEPYMNNGSLSPPIPRMVSVIPCFSLLSPRCPPYLQGLGSVFSEIKGTPPHHHHLHSPEVWIDFHWP
uniref:CTNNB1 binding N-teminal domain-containing protein n=1 Tax=Cyprinus carpio TaxID=7962 RepID=A0A8C1ZN05_CYPCA